MFEDPIVNEIRQARDKIAAQYDYDIHRLFAHWREMEQKHPGQLVRSVEEAEQKSIAGKTT